MATTGFSTELARLMAEQRISVRALAALSGYSKTHIDELKRGVRGPSPEAAQDLDDALRADGQLAVRAPKKELVRPESCAGHSEPLHDAANGDQLALNPGRKDEHRSADVADDELDALELARRAGSSDVGDGTCERLELVVDDLAVAYPRTVAADLMPRVRRHLGYVMGLLDARATLAQRRRLLVSGGWLSLLAATLLTDLNQNAAAESYLRTAAQLAQETGHAVIKAWCVETRAWQALTSGSYRNAVDLSQAAQEIAPRPSSVRIQATAQEGRAWARLGDSRPTRVALAAVEQLVSPLPQPECPEHHYVYDPPKARVYVATTLTWLHDSAAEGAARDILYSLEHPDGGPLRPRRIALARLDLGLALVTAGKHDEASATALAAVRSGRLAPVDRPRVWEIVAAVTSRHVPGARELTDAYHGEYGDGQADSGADTRTVPKP
jgi:transcriptional regulator with XRE-family HTH domain